MPSGMPYKAALPLAAVLSLLFASTSFAAPTPPFKQCPVVGYDTSCQLLIDFSSTGTATVLTDPSQGAFDGVEDTLIGVQNDSPVTVNSFTVTATSSSTDPPFSFDGDGACSGVNSNPGLGTFAPPPAGCPFGPSGYEGPGVSYTNISADDNSGTVTFAGGIPSGGSAWFSLEGQVTASSISIPPPPMVTITTPGNGDTYPEGTSLTPSFMCKDGVGAPGLLPGTAGCSGPTSINTSTPGNYCVTATATSQDGESTTAKSCYTVISYPPPTVTFTSPGNGSTYLEGSTVTPSFTCMDGAGAPGLLPGSAGCSGPSTVNTSTPGTHCYTVTATSQDGQSTPVTNCYTVVAPTYTGDADNLSATASVLGAIKVPLTTINNIGPIAKTVASNNSNTIITESVPPLGLSGSQLLSSVVTAVGSSTATASTNGLSLGLPVAGAAVISTGEIQASSQTTCTASTGAISSTPSVTIASLKIGTMTVNIPSPIPKNDKISLGALGSVTLNEQTPITDGLAVNAIDIRLLTDEGLGSAQVIIGHAESDVEGC